jgi:folate-binding protein YgfZ
MADGRRIEGIHEMVVVEGPQAISFLDGLLSQDLSKLHPTHPIRSFLLAPQGKLRALLWITGEGERVEVVADAGWGKKVADDLAHYKIRVKATIAEPIPVTTVVGPDLAYTFLRPGSEATELSFDEWNAIRIEAGEPVMGIDVDDNTIPQETGLVDKAVSFSKGCFLGQELVARLDSRNGRVNRHLRRVQLEKLPTVPAAVADNGGFITSAAVTANGATGLGLLHRRINPGDRILVDGVRAVVL